MQKCIFTVLTLFLQINCSNTHRVGRSYDFAAIDCQIEICEHAFHCKCRNRVVYKISQLFSWASELSFVFKFKLQKSRRIILAKINNKKQDNE